MSNVTATLYQKASKAKADGTAPVYVRVTANRKSTLVSTGIYVEPRHWNKARGRVRAGHDLADAYNARLQGALNDAREAALSATSAAAVKDALDGPGGSLTAYVERFIERLRAKGDTAHWEVKKYSTTLAKLRGALGAELSWAEVDRDALDAFERYCRETKGNAPNTVRKELVRLRTVYRAALRDGVLSAADDPFVTYTMPRKERVERRKLTLEDVQALAALTPEDGVADGSVEAVARDAFAFSFYASGMRFGDVCCLKAADVRDDRATYRTMKTGRPLSVPLPPPATEIANRYAESAATRGGFLFPLLREGDDRDGVTLRKRISSRNVQVNAALKRLADKADLEREGLSFHVARHSYADHARTTSGNLYAISKSLGHSNLSVTEGYLASLDRDAVDGLAEELWS
ncbi:tyrosine-type recombinase/integrase [Rubrivirga sp.]|uniref:tyrosine-type recombinase/integrase n=1 Tax=Rubrivirga sp. TaxID=1885344 RepID=UPI003C77F41E